MTIIFAAQASYVAFPRSELGNTDIVLSDSVKSKHFSAGYYSDFTVTGDFTELPDVTLTYTHHIHSLESSTYSEENDSMDVNSVPVTYADGYQATTLYPNGCFTTPYYHLVYSEYGTCGGAVYGHFDCHDDPSTWYTKYSCSKCGKSYGSDGGDHSGFYRWCSAQTVNNYNLWTTNPSGHEGNITETRYIKSCGRSSGEVTDIHIHY